MNTTPRKGRKYYLPADYYAAAAWVDPHSGRQYATYMGALTRDGWWVFQGSTSDNIFIPAGSEVEPR